jgi:nucleoid DNA-binding protein
MSRDCILQKIAATETIVTRVMIVINHLDACQISAFGTWQTRNRNGGRSRRVKSRLATAWTMENRSVEGIGEDMTT